MPCQDTQTNTPANQPEPFVKDVSTKANGMHQDWKSILHHAISIRHALHRAPEMAWEEVETAKAIRSELDRMAIPWRPCAKTGTLATLAPAAKGAHVGLRGDIDALPILEDTGVAYSSEIPGRMHACGHDGHTATLLAAGNWLKLHEANLPGPVTLLFQPAEEGGHGAERMVEDGALDALDTLFGWHNWPAIPFGQAVCPNGPVMAANATFHIFLKGRGGHSSQPELCRDPVLAASAITLALQQIVSRRLKPQEAAVVSVTSIHAPSGLTIIPETAQLAGSIRAADTALRDRVCALIEEIAASAAASYGVKATIKLEPRYGATVNHPAEAARYREALEGVLGAHWQCRETAIPLMASEDFSDFLLRKPGAFALIGSDDGNGHDAPCHSPHYDFNDRLITPVVRLFSRLVGAPEPQPPE